MSVYLLSYNNYYNRIVKREETYEDYTAAAAYYYGPIQCNFNPNDGISTSHTFNTLNLEFEPDYLIVLNDNNEIIGRWFILDRIRKSGQQYIFDLYRDTIAEHLETIKAAPAFIEKGLLGPQDNFIFNNENMTYNQIKTSESALKDKTKTAWIVGYLGKDAVSTDPISFTPKPSFDFAASSLSEFEPFVKYSAGGTTVLRDVTKISNVYMEFELTSDYDGESRNAILTENYNLSDVKKKTSDVNTSYYALATEDNADIQAIKVGLQLSAKFKEVATNTDLLTKVFEKNEDDNEEFLNCHGKILRVGNAENLYTYYYINMYPLYFSNIIEEIPNNRNKELYDRTMGAVLRTDAEWPNQKGLSAKIDYTRYYLAFTDITKTFKKYEVTISANRNSLSDAPYDMFCFPLEHIDIGGVRYNTGKSAMQLGSEMFKALGGTGVSNIYDIQLLPYCPLSNIERIMTDGLYGLEENTDYNWIDIVEDGTRTHESILFYCTSSSFNLAIPFVIRQPSNAIDLKISSECDKYRICSPNYESAFDFSAAKNGGVQYIEVNATYKPYNPYIHLNPNWGRLYGTTDFNDNRGLILNGDFSIAKIDDAWVDYELQNKNYQKIFDRQIQNMDTVNSVQRELEKWSAATGVGQGAAMGAFVGSKGGPWAAAAGAVIGGAGSAIGGIANIELNERLRTEARDYAKDMFGYQLQTIQALPQSLSKTSAYDINNKIFPFVEYYTATDGEKEALRNKIKYNGMTVMRIDKIENFITNEESYIKAKLIRLEDIDLDFHIVNIIANELNQGIFIKEEE